VLGSNPVLFIIVYQVTGMYRCITLYMCLEPSFLAPDCWVLSDVFVYGTSVFPFGHGWAGNGGQLRWMADKNS
jgi:hypothetical protein